MTLPLLPGPDRPPRWCRACHRPVPKGQMVDGLGSSCARDHGLTPPTIRRPRTHGQDGPDLFDSLTETAAQPYAEPPPTMIRNARWAGKM